MDHVRVLRLYEFSGPRVQVEAQLLSSLQGSKTWGPVGKEVTIRVATLGNFPEIMELTDAK